MSGIKFWERVRYRSRELQLFTDGLSKRGQDEIMISVESSDLMPQAKFFLKFVVKYLDTEKARITSHQTMNFGYWLVKFEPAGDGYLDVWEYDSVFESFIHGGSLALRYWRDQLATCESVGANFYPPNPGKMTAVSSGVMEGHPVQAVRYSLGDPMSGWLIVTDQYNGDITTLTTHHTYHVTAARPDLAKFLALPCGFRFDQTSGEKVWFDPEAAASEFA
jgi:hypothetical protein